MVTSAAAVMSPMRVAPTRWTTFRAPRSWAAAVSEEMVKYAPTKIESISIESQKIPGTTSARASQATAPAAEATSAVRSGVRAEGRCPRSAMAETPRAVGMRVEPSAITQETTTPATTTGCTRASAASGCGEAPSSEKTRKIATSRTRETAAARRGTPGCDSSESA